MTTNHSYRVNYTHNCIDVHENVPDNGHWMKCPYCNLLPKIWEFDNGRRTACGCWNSKYDYFSVRAESIMSVHTRTNGKGLNQYVSDQLRVNWNEYCATMINSCSHNDLREEDKW